MGRRKRKQQTYRPQRTTPKIFDCPRCGKKTIKAIMEKGKDKVLVKCGHCGLEEWVSRNELTEPVDAFGEFIDIYYKDREYQRLLEREKELWEKEQYTELTLVYSLLADIARINVQKSLEKFKETGDPEFKEKADIWEDTLKTYEDNRKQLLNGLETGELVDADLDSEIFETEEIAPDDDTERDRVYEKPKKRTNIEDILGDTGFLEF